MPSQTFREFALLQPKPDTRVRAVLKPSNLRAGILVTGGACLLLAALAVLLRWLTVNWLGPEFSRVLSGMAVLAVFVGWGVAIGWWADSRYGIVLDTTWLMVMMVVAKTLLLCIPVMLFLWLAPFPWTSGNTGGLILLIAFILLSGWAIQHTIWSSGSARAPGISLTVPAGWQREELAKGKEILFRSPDSGGPSIKVIRRKSVDLNMTVPMTKNIYGKTLKEFKLLEEGVREVGDLRVFVLRYSHDFQGQERTGTLAWFPLGGKWYEFTFRGPGEDPLIEPVLGSVSLVSDAGSSAQAVGE